MQIQTINIDFPSGGELLKGVLHLPDIHKPPVVIGSHGLESSGSSPKQLDLARRCNELGIAYFRFDHKGCGDSTGDFLKITTLPSRCEDLLNAVDTVKKSGHTNKSICFFGSSLGGATCLLAALTADIKGMVIVASPADSKTIELPPDDFNSRYGLTPEFYKNNLNFDLTKDISVLKNVFVVHGDEDEIVTVKNADIIFNAVNEPKKKLIFKGGDHLISNLSHQKQFIDEASAFLENLLK
ncbi:MAG: prolyl oligopeptidase family serine peptidase [Desulfobacterales bacterium]|nr:prolyl oligopeptidase family serine peptidase [Desulfobacterales bacterium]MCP4160780.1 prolyl oligopeptidase family serine peptidase [Deltaproteobacteria bacterium]